MKLKEKKKADSYLGFARKAGKVIMGSGLCLSQMDKGKIKLLIIAVDTSENTVKKLKSKAWRSCTEYRLYGTSEHLSRLTGSPGRTVFGITDESVFSLFFVITKISLNLISLFSFKFSS